MRAKRDGKCFKLNYRERSERKFFGKFSTFPPNSSKLRSDYLFSFQKRTNYLFPAFSRSEYLFPKNASPPPPRIKWSSPYELVKNSWILNKVWTFNIVIRSGSVDKVAVFQIEKKTSVVQIQLVQIDIFSLVLFLFIYGVLQGDKFLAGYFYIF